MKTYNLTTTKDSDTATYYVDVEGDFLETKEDADLLGAVAEVIVDGFFVGSADEMKQAAHEKYLDAIA